MLNFELFINRQLAIGNKQKQKVISKNNQPTNQPTN
jgi:hypothetical protein